MDILRAKSNREPYIRKKPPKEEKPEGEEGEDDENPASESEKQKN